MISELFLIRNNSSFWNELFPGGDDYIRLINAGLGKQAYDPLDKEEDPNRRAIINNLAFALFEISLTKKDSIKFINDYNSNSDFGKKLFDQEINRLSNVRFGKFIKKIPDANEVDILQKIASRLYWNYIKNRELKIRPIFPGCGILNSAEGDIYYSGTLVEIKAGQRNFNIQDLRQLYTYLALNQINKDYEINSIELFNPRTGLLWKENKEIVSQSISGNSTIEIVTEIINHVSNEINSI